MKVKIGSNFKYVDLFYTIETLNSISYTMWYIIKTGDDIEFNRRFDAVYSGAGGLIDAKHSVEMLQCPRRYAGHLCSGISMCTYRLPWSPSAGI